MPVSQSISQFLVNFLFVVCTLITLRLKALWAILDLGGIRDTDRPCRGKGEGGESGGFRNGDSGILRPIQRVIISHSFLFRGFIESPELPLVRPRHTVLLIVLQY